MDQALEQSRVALPSMPGQLTLTGYRLPPGLPYEEWDEIGRTLLSIGRAAQWWIGDWLRYGEAAYGEKYTQALEATDYDYQSLRDMSWVAGKVAVSRRRDTVSWSHHREVADLEPADQDRWLDAAEQGRWTREETREHIRRAKHPELPQLITMRFKLTPAAVEALKVVIARRNCTDSEAVCFALVETAARWEGA